MDDTRGRIRFSLNIKCYVCVMLQKFRKNAKKIVKKTAGIGLGVLFALAASHSTAHGYTAKDILHNSGCDDPVIAHKLHVAMEKASGGRGYSIIDIDKIKVPKGMMEKGATKEEVQQALSENIKKQIAADATLSPTERQNYTKTFSPLIDEITTEYVNKADGKVSKDGWDLIDNEAMALPLDSIFSKQRTLIFLHLSTAYDVNYFFGNKELSALGPEASYLLSSFIAVHEAKHVSHYIQSIAHSGYKFEMENSADATVKKEALKRMNSIQIGKESESDEVAARFIIDIAPSKDAALSFLKGWAGFRAKGLIQGDEAIDHNTLSTLTKVIREIDPSYPSIQTTNHDQSEKMAHDARHALELASQHNKNNSKLSGEDFAQTHNGRNLLRIHAIALENAEARSNLIQASNNSEVLQAPACGTYGIKPNPGRRDKGPS